MKTELSAMSETLKYKWTCEKCRKSAAVKIDENADVMSIVREVKASHAEKSAACEFKAGRVRVEKV